jgi:hypothetical protein
VLCVLRSLVVSIFVIVILRCHLTNPFFLPSLHFLLVVGYCASDCWDPPSSAPRFLVGCWVLRLGLLGSALLGSSVAPPRLFGARLVLFGPSGLLLGAPHETLRPVLLLLGTPHETLRPGLLLLGTPLQSSGKFFFFNICHAFAFFHCTHSTSFPLYLLG